MTRTRILVVVSFLVAFAAGFALGAAVRHSARSHRTSWLSDQLGLTPEQGKQMRAIWSDVMQKSMHNRSEQRRALQAERDQAVRALLNDKEKEAQYDAILKQYEDKTSGLAKEGRNARDEAVARTMEILKEPQRERFKEFLRQGEEHGWGRRGPRPAAAPAPASPAAAGQ